MIIKRVASYAPLLRPGTNDATRATSKLHALQKSYDCPINSTLKIFFVQINCALDILFPTILFLKIRYQAS